jgi:Fic family protein
MKYIYQRKNWPEFSWDEELLFALSGSVRSKQGKILGRMEALGFDIKTDANLETLTLDVLKSSEIEGELLDQHQVRSSVARHLGLEISGLVPSDRNVDGVVQMMLDATQHYKKKLTQERLFGWHSALFPVKSKNNNTIKIGDWRDDSTGPMQVISGPMGKNRVHFQAPDSGLVKPEMKTFIAWFNGEQKLDPVIKAAVAHLWFITLHPFDDGNGRIARALTDLLLARADESPQRFYSMSAQIRLDRKHYYNILEKTQKGDLDITGWLKWFLECLSATLDNTTTILEKVLFKGQFWQQNATSDFNKRQIVILNRLLDGFEGKLTSSKWAKMGKCSSDTALRDIQDLVSKNVLVKEQAGGRSTNYELKRN